MALNRVFEDRLVSNPVHGVDAIMPVEWMVGRADQIWCKACIKKAERHSWYKWGDSDELLHLVIPFFEQNGYNALVEIQLLCTSNARR